MIHQLEIQNKCTNCDNCRQVCMVNAIIQADSKYIVDNSACTECFLCIKVCPEDAIKVFQKEYEQFT